MYCQRFTLGASLQVKAKYFGLFLPDRVLSVTKDEAKIASQNVSQQRSGLASRFGHTIEFSMCAPCKIDSAIEVVMAGCVGQTFLSVLGLFDLPVLAHSAGMSLALVSYVA